MRTNTNVGDTYRQIAKTHLSGRSDLEHSHITKIVASNNYAELENVARIEKAIVHAIINIKWMAREHDLAIPQGFIDRTLHGVEIGNYRMTAAGGSRQPIQDDDILDDVYQQIVIFGLHGMHDGLVENSRDAFFKEEITKEGDLSRYMPLVLTGDNELERCFDLISPILLDLGLDLRHDVVSLAFADYRANYLENMHIKCDADLVNWIRKGRDFYSFLPYKVSQYLKEDSVIAEKIALTIFSRNGVTLSPRRIVEVI